MDRPVGRRSPVHALIAVTFAVSTFLTGLFAHQVSAQEEIAAAMIEGACDNPGDVVADLRPLTVAEGGARTSFTTIDLPIAELTGSDYAIIAGDPDSPAVCGEIAGDGDDIYLTLPARDEMNLSGVAWLHARDERTQVSLFLGEDLGGGTSPTSSGQPEPPAEETPEPAGQTAETVTYTSPSYGYSVTHDAELWRVVMDETQPTGDGPFDYYILASGNAVAQFFGFPGAPWLTTQQIVSNVHNSLIDDPKRYGDVVVRTRGGDETKAFAIIDFDLLYENGTRQELTYHVVSWHVPGDAYANMLFEVPRAEYDDWTAEREELEGGVAIPSK